MKVKDFIEALKLCNQEADVIIDDWGETYRSPLSLERGGIYTDNETVLLGNSDSEGYY